jgi:hypothetical protein
MECTDVHPPDDATLSHQTNDGLGIVLSLTLIDTVLENYTATEGTGLPLLPKGEGMVMTNS